LPSVERLCGPRKLIGGRGSRRWEGRAGAGAPRRMVRCAVADWPGAPLAPAVPHRGIPRKKWPVSLGCRGMLGPPDGVGYGVKKMALETMGGNLGGPGPGKFTPIFRSQSAREAAPPKATSGSRRISDPGSPLFRGLSLRFDIGPTAGAERAALRSSNLRLEAKQGSC
jgi:hypothetical protein